MSGENHFPFSARKCRCAECIINNNKMGAKSLANGQHCYKNIHQKDEHGTRHRYTLNLQDQSHLEKEQAKERNGCDIMMKWWPGKQPIPYTIERGPTFFQTTTDQLTTKLYEPSKPLLPGTEDVLASGFNKRNSFSQLQTTQAVKSRETKAKDNGCHWSWSGNSEAFQLQKQQGLTNIHQTNPIKHLQDPRLTNQDNSDSIYHGWGNLLPANKLGRPEGYGGKPIEQTRTRASSFKQNATLANWWHSSSVSHCPVTTYATNDYQERSTFRHLGTDSANEERKLRTWGMHKQTSPGRFTSFGNSNTFFKETDSEIAHNHQSMPPQRKPHRTSESEINYFSKQPAIDAKKQKLASPCSPDQLTHLGAKTICDFNSNVQKMNSQEMMINKKEFKDIHDAKNSETCAREERIRNLKALLAKQEKALEALKYQRKPSISIDEKGDNIVFNGHSPSIDEEVFPNPLKRRWLKNWNEEDGFDHISTKIKRRKELNSHNTKTEEENQALSNAEFTAVEGLVRLSKD